MAVTRTVSIREFRKNMTKFLRDAQEKNIHFVIMRHSQPVAHIVHAQYSNSLEALTADVAAARKETKHGKTFSSQEVREILGL